MLLYACFVGNGRSEQRPTALLRSFKTFAFAESTSLKSFGQQYGQRKFFKILENDRSMKKLLAEAFA